MDDVLAALEAAAAAHLEGIRAAAVTPSVGAREIREHLRARYDFSAPLESAVLNADVREMLDAWTVHCEHPRYFGLFNPPALPITAVADALVAIHNPQVGTWGHAPMACEIERHVLAFLAARIGIPLGIAQFTSGGQEANTTALGAALVHAFPDFVVGGARALAAAPRLYCSTHAHHSLHRAARLTGIGSEAISLIPADGHGRMSAAALGERIASDRAAGHRPFLVVATAGTTGCGAIDPLPEISAIAASEGLWCHVDAAWGGAAVLSERLRPHLAGIEAADSVTWDAHKGLHVPMGAGMLFSRHREPLHTLFGIATGYVPPAVFDFDEPYLTSAQWSRRFIGLKVFMALASRSAPGLAGLVEQEADMGDRLRERLDAHGWRLVNQTPLPVACFTHPSLTSPAAHARVVERVQHGGRAWISALDLPEGGRVLRACITSHATGPEDLELLIGELELARSEVA